MPTFSATVRCGNSPTDWKPYPIRRRSSGPGTPRTSTPSTSIRPAVGSISRFTSLSVVVFPLPDPPTSIRHSPGATRSERPSTALRSP
jgi:hypothetical protein